MLNLKSIYESVIINESKPKHLYENGDMTFAEIRDIVTDVFKDGGIVLKKKVPGMEILVTYKNGDFCIATDVNELAKPCCYKNFTNRCCKANKDVKTAFMNTLSDLMEALNQLDPVLLNKYFANGQNYIDCQIVFPVDGFCEDYGNKCFVTFNKIKCYDKNYKEVGEDADSARDLFDSLRQNELLQQEVSELQPECISSLSKCVSGKKILEKILAKLQQFIDGVGWGCSINSYIQDKYSRYIINKALAHGLDVSRNSSFVNELVSRQCGMKMRPTKSDLVCFAKREGINCNSQEYRDFLNNVEQSNEDICQKIISPIENLLCYAVSQAMRNIVGYLTIDPSKKTKKFLTGIDQSCYEFDESEDGDTIWNKDKMEPLKKNFSRACQYFSAMPATKIVLMYNNSPYIAVSKLGKLDKLCKLIGCC